MVNQPKISVIVPVYNGDQYLCQCLESLLRQTFTDFEILVVNDGSAGFSYQICQKFAHQDSRVRIFNQANQGQAVARNLALDRARGEYITFVDADDYVVEQYLTALYQAALEQDAEIVVGEYFRYSDAEKKWYYHVFEKDYQVAVYEGNTFLSKYNQIVFTPVWGKLFKATLFEYIRFPALSSHEDNFVIQKLYLKANRIAYLVDNLYCYQTRGVSTMHSDRTLEKIANNVASLEEKYFDLVLANQDTAGIRGMYHYGLVEHKKYLEERALTDTTIYLKICSRPELLAQH